MSFAQPFHDYEILDRVGAGAMGTVFKARHKKLGRIVALKVLRPSLARDARFVDRLRREARIVAALNHPHIVTGYDLGEEGGYHYFVMEFVEGRALSALLAEWGIFAEDQVLKVATQVASALDHAFQRNVIHRDVKPGNILIDETGIVKLTDMGLAKGPADLTLTRDGATVGTPQYISPEQARNPQDVDIRSDLYSLGATLYHMATGQPPFKGDSMAEVITQVLHEVPIAPRVINPALSEGLALVIRKLLAKNLRLRYQTPRELLDDLERVRNEQPPQVDESRLSAGETDAQASPLKWSLGVVAGAALLAGAVWLGTQLTTGQLHGEPPDAWLSALSKELDTLPNPGQRLMRLRLAATEAPPGTAVAVDQLQRQIAVLVQREVTVLGAELTGPSWPAIEAAIDDPQRWPGAAEVARDRVERRLLEATGLLRDQLPSGVDASGLDDIVAEIGRRVEQRDRTLADRARHWVDVALPARADAKLREGDFAAADRVWREGQAAFFDGVRQPAFERVAEAVRAPVQQRFAQAQKDGLEQVDTAERRKAGALALETREGIAALRQQLGGSSPPARVREAAARLREQLERAYPGGVRFRAAADPWPEVQAQFTALDRELALVERDRRALAADQLVDLAWRAFCDGDAAAALGVLGEPAGDAAELSKHLDQHRSALRAAGLVAAAVLRALQHAPAPLPGYPRNGGETVELRVDDGQLMAQAAGGNWRAARLTEFRFTDLWQRANRAAADAFAAIDQKDLERGRIVLAMAGDDLQALPQKLASEQPFLRDEVWPRLLLVRGEQRGGGVDRALAFQRLREAFDRAPSQADPGELELALKTWRAGFGTEASTGEAALADAAATWIERERARLQRLETLRRQVPAEATVDVAYDGPSLRAEVSLPPTALRGAGEGWQVRDGRLEFACAAPVWSDVERRRLDVTMFGADAPEAAVDVDLAVPPAERGPRTYVIAFRGIGCVVTATSDDRVFAMFVDGDVRRANNVQAALCRALVAATVRDGPQGRVLPGAVHRLTMVVNVSPGHRNGAARVSLDGVELCQHQVTVEPSQAPQFVLYPLQDVTIAQVRLRSLSP